MGISRFQARKEVPVTLKQLLRLASPRVWGGKSFQRTAETNVWDACEIMGDPKLTDIDTDMIAEYAQVVSEGVRPATVNRKLSCLHTILKYAYDREWIQRMPKFEWRKEDNEYIRWLSKDEEEQLLRLLPERISAFVEILIHTGMRRGELLTMKPEQVDGDYARLWKTKTKKARSVPLTDRAKELLLKHLPFSDIGISHIRWEWDKARTAMGLMDDRHFCMHMLRHTAATRVLDTTGRLEVVQKVLGHSKIATTQRYAHLSDETLLDAIRRTAQKHGNGLVSA